MKRFVLAVTAIAWPLAAQPPAHPQLDCPFEGVATEQRALAVSAAAQQLTDVPPTGDAQRSQAALDAILANVPRCAQARRWTTNQSELARAYVLMQLTREEMLQRYDAQNVNLRFIDEELMAARPGEPPPFEAWVSRVRAQGVGDNRPDSAGDIVHIYMTLAYQIGAIRTGFADPNFQLR